MDRPTAILRRHRVALLATLAAMLVLGALADIANPLLPAVTILAVLAASALGAALLLRWRRPGSIGPAVVPVLGLLLAGFGGLALLQRAADSPRGVLARHLDAPAALQDALLPVPASTPHRAEELRAALASGEAAPRTRPASADEFLYNAHLFASRGEPVRAARALAEALRREAEARPDALLLHTALLDTGNRAVTELLVPPPSGLAPQARAYLAAMALPAADRAAALGALAAAHPDWPLAVAAHARALAAASPDGPTVAQARRIAAALDAFEEPDLAEPFVATFLDRAAGERQVAELRGLAPLRAVAARRLTVAAQGPPPGMPNAPMLIRVTPPEPARSVQVLREDAQGELWVEVPQRIDDPRGSAGDPVPTLRLMRPWRAAEMRFRYLDREGVMSEPVAWRFEPAQPMREAAQRALQRQGPFALYQPGRIAPGRLNALPVAAHHRAGLSAIEWHTDAEPQPRTVPVGVSDEAVLAGEVARTTVEFTVPAAARVLFLTATYADGTRSPTAELAIR